MHKVIKNEWYWCSECSKIAEGAKVCPDCYIKLAERIEANAVKQKTANADKK